MKWEKSSFKGMICEVPSKKKSLKIIICYSETNMFSDFTHPSFSQKVQK